MKTGLVSGRIWQDENQNGIMDENEPGVSGCSITLTGEKNGLTYTFTTDDTGIYKMLARTDTYLMSFTCPEGMTFTRPSAMGGVKRSIFTLEGAKVGGRKYVLESGTQEMDQNIGLVPDVNLSGIAFMDENYNGEWNEGEQLLSGAMVELSTTAGKTIGSTVTGEDGLFRFVSLRGGEYRLRAVLPDTGVVFTKAAQSGVYGNQFVKSKGKMDSTIILVLTSGEDRTVGVGAVVPGSLAGGVFEDENYNGLFDVGEKAVSGVVVKLLDPDGNIAASTETIADGTYAFDSLMPMKYTLAVEKPSGWMFTKQAEGQNKSLVVSADSDEGFSAAIAIALGQQVESIYAGIIPPAQVTGLVFGDANDDGLQNNQETGSEGVTVTLLNEAGQEVLKQVTGDDGLYAFYDLHPGKYALRYDLPVETVFAKTMNGGNQLAGESTAAAGDVFQLDIGEAKQAPLCGAVALGRISGVTFHDVNANGMYEVEEELLEGVELTLADKIEGTVVYTITTGKDGLFTMDRLRPGSYTLNAVLPDNMIFTRDGEEILMPSSLKSQESTDLVLVMGQQMDRRFIGGTVPASVAGRVWLDENNNGLMEPDESSVSGLKVVFTDNQTGSQYATLETNESGTYTMPVIHPGSYNVTVMLPHNSIAAAAGDNQFVDSAPQEMAFSNLSVLEGEAIVDLRAGVRQYTSIEGTVWADEQGQTKTLSNAHVYLYESGDLDNPVMTYVTAENGMYKFDQLMPGEYCIAAKLPDGYLFVKPQDTRLTSGQAISIINHAETGKSDVFQLHMGKDHNAQDVGTVKAGSLGDIAWLDENKNGLQDTGEPGIPGLKVSLLQDGIVVGETVTDMYGYYLFEDQYPMNSQLQVTMYPELLPTEQKTDYPLLCSVVKGYEQETAYSVDLPVYSGGQNFNCDLGFVLKDGAKRPDAIKALPGQKWK